MHIVMAPLRELISNPTRHTFAGSADDLRGATGICRRSSAILAYVDPAVNTGEGLLLRRIVVASARPQRAGCRDHCCSPPPLGGAAPLAPEWIFQGVR